jgi:hypothetical protein
MPEVSTQDSAGAARQPASHRVRLAGAAFSAIPASFHLQKGKEKGLPVPTCQENLGS